jgi:hypothetical protein
MKHWLRHLGALIALLAATAAQSQNATKEEMFSKPGVIGDSLSQGFYSGVVEPKTQNWAYPVLVTKKAQKWAFPDKESRENNSSPLSYNELDGPFLNLEDHIKKPDCIACLFRVKRGQQGEKTVELPSHAGITGADYTTVLNTSGKCVDIDIHHHYITILGFDIRLPGCEKPDGFHRLGLRGAGTQMQVMQELKPTFLFGTVAANHVLCTAIQTSTDCLNMKRFKRDFRKTLKKLDAIGSIKGGVLFTIPDVSTLPFLVRDHNPRSSRFGLRAFYRSNHTRMDADEVIDRDEEEEIKEFTTEMNEVIKFEANARGWAVADLNKVFNDIKENGRSIMRPDAEDKGSEKALVARASWPDPVTTRVQYSEEEARKGPLPGVDEEDRKSALDVFDRAMKDYKRGRVSDNGQLPDIPEFYLVTFITTVRPGIFGLDGIHPNMLGHAVMANELIGAINKQYNFDIPLVSEYRAWEHDALNQAAVEPVGFGSWLFTLLARMFT